MKAFLPPQMSWYYFFKFGFGQQQSITNNIFVENQFLFEYINHL